MEIWKPQAVDSRIIINLRPFIKLWLLIRPLNLFWKDPTSPSHIYVHFLSAVHLPRLLFFRPSEKGSESTRVRTRLWDICGFRFSLPPTGCCWRHARIPFDKGRRSSGPIIQTSRHGREDRRDGVSKATCSLSARSLTPCPLAGQSGAAKRKRVGKVERSMRKKERDAEHDAIYSYPAAQHVVP